jgi:DNA polymerase-3 subunit epsilon
MDSTMAIFDAEITVLDYESTGTVRGFPDEPWQLGMVSLIKGRVDGDSIFESLLSVDINRPFNPNAPGRHARRREEIAAAPAPQELWPTVMNRLTRFPLCAHNVSTEKKLVRGMAPMHRFGPWIDTLKIARRALPGCISYALEDLIVLLDLKPKIDAVCPGREAHDALYDAVAAAVLLEYLLEQPGWERITVGELASL